MPKPRTYIVYLIVAVLSFLSAALQAQVFPQNYSWQQIGTEQNLSLKLEMIAEAARYNSQLAAKYRLADSLAIHGVKLAKASGDETLEKRALEIFFKNVDIRVNSAYALELIKPLLNSTNIAEQWQGYIYASSVSELNYNEEQGLQQANKAALLALQLGDTLARGISYYHRALNLKRLEGRKINALTNFLKAKDIFYQFKEDELFVELCLELAMFYVDAKSVDKSQQHLDEAIAVFKNSAELDSIYGLDIRVQRVYAEYLNENNIIIEEELKKSIAKVARRNFNDQKRDYLTIYRTYLITNQNFEGLYKLYLDDFPLEFKRIKQGKGELYYRMMAYFKEYQGDLDSASYYWNKAINLDYIVKDKNRKTNLYVRYAEYLHRIGNTIAAIDYYQMAFDTAFYINTPSYEYRASIGLDSMYRFKGDYVRAYEWRKKATEIKASIDRDNEEEKLLLTQVIYNSEKDKEKQALKMKSVERGFMGVMAGLIIVLILSIVIYLQFRQTNKEKKRSDELLLNILPEETAAELKEKGRTSARRYNDVTIVFADIVGFSKVAETLEPGELVQEIDRYFRAFDDLTRVYGLEKIKTIGDAYVAVSGLPQGNLSTAKDAVKLALSMQRVVNELNQLRQDSPFKLRIGLNTGDVVAGVVGSRKFQFDIWGDAVNIAARMEQNGEPDKVNVSQTTFELTKNDFKYAYRGKVSAKNKGELDMYFVDV